MTVPTTISVSKPPPPSEMATTSTTISSENRGEEGVPDDGHDDHPDKPDPDGVWFDPTTKIIPSAHGAIETTNSTATTSASTPNDGGTRVETTTGMASAAAVPTSTPPVSKTTSNNKSKIKRPKKIRGLDGMNASKSNNYSYSGSRWFTERWQGQRFSLALASNSVIVNSRRNNKNGESYMQDSTSSSPSSSSSSSSLPEGVLFHCQSEYQEILVFQSIQYGKVFAIDGIIQLTELDAFVFHEMMAHIPLFAHSCPKDVLIVGAGDGLILHEVLKHPEVERITLVEIDPMVVTAAKQFLNLVPSENFDDPRVTIIHEDAADFLRNLRQQEEQIQSYDVILADTLDPLGPAESLFEPEFYEDMHGALKDGGIMCTQGESIWLHKDLIRDLIACCSEMFSSVEYAQCNVPSYPTGVIGFIVARKGGYDSSLLRRCSIPIRRPTPPIQLMLKWYNPSIHRASFVLPPYIQTELEIEDNGTFISKPDEEVGDNDQQRLTANKIVVTNSNTVENRHHLYDENGSNENENDECCFHSGMCTIQ